MNIDAVKEMVLDTISESIKDANGDTMKMLLSVLAAGNPKAFREALPAFGLSPIKKTGPAIMAQEEIDKALSAIDTMLRKCNSEVLSFDRFELHTAIGKVTINLALTR